MAARAEMAESVMAVEAHSGRILIAENAVEFALHHHTFCGAIKIEIEHVLGVNLSSHDPRGHQGAGVDREQVVGQSA